MPFSAGSLGMNTGTELAPEEIIKQTVNIFSNENNRELKIELSSVNVNNSDIEESQQNIFNKIKQLNEFAIMLGGDHSITYSSFKAFAANNPDAGLILFDAHADCCEGTKNPTHEDYIRDLIEEGTLKAENLIIIGLRNWHINEMNFLKQNKIMFFDMKKIFELKAEEVCDSVMEIARNWSSLYISIDIDCIDPAFAPGTGYLEPGGLTAREMIYFVQRLKLLKNLRMVDLVEVNPKKDVNGMTSKLAAKIVCEFY